MKNTDSYIVYKHTAPSNKAYIGITKKSMQERSGVEGIHYKKNAHFYSAIKKYGWNNFKHEILCENLTKEEASDKEKYYIDLYNTSDSRFGYNNTTGGETNYSCTEEVRNKIADKTRMQWKDKEIREKMIKGLKMSHLGKYTEAQREANNKRRGTHLSEEQKQKLRGRTPWNKGKKVMFSESGRLKQVLSHKGKIPPNKGTHLSEEEKRIVSEKTKEGMKNPEVKQKIIIANKKRTGKVFKYIVNQYDLEGNLIAKYKGYANASRETGINKSGISNCIYGKTKTCGGYIWTISTKESVV